MTVRTTEKQDEQISELAAKWGVSKNEAVVRAVAESLNAGELDADFMDAYEHVSTKYREALDRLGSV